MIRKKSKSTLPFLSDSLQDLINSGSNFSNSFKTTEALKINITGNLNLRGNKINFKKISMNNIYIASKEDLKYFKIVFESILFDEGILEIFELKKIKEFILEIS